jgi:hypothetical protein
MRRTLSLVVPQFLVAATMAVAQVQTGSILVRAFDEQGSMVPGATVVIASAILPQRIVGSTDSSGAYHIPGLPAGTYTVTPRSPASRPSCATRFLSPRDRLSRWTS